MTESRIIDKFQHMGAYTVLMVSALWLCHGRHLRPWLVALIALGIGIEFAQANGQMGREGSWLDAIANGLGVVIGAFIYRCVHTKRVQ